MASFLFMIACAAGPPDLEPEPVSAPEYAADADAVAPCTEPWSTNTRVSYADRTIALHRFRPGADPERLVFALDEIGAVEMGRTPIDGAPEECVAIHLVMRDGRRVLFDDERVLPRAPGGAEGLEPRARRLAESIGVPVLVAAASDDGAADTRDADAAP